MSHLGKTQLTVIFTVTPDLVAEGDRIFESHATWMEESHYREGELALLLYNVAKGEDLSNPLDPSSDSTGKTSYVLTEVYETPAGLEDHWRQGTTSWDEFGSFAEWAGKAQVVALHGSSVIHSLW